jgi:hypothetical protein
MQLRRPIQPFASGRPDLAPKLHFPSLAQRMSADGLANSLSGWTPPSRASMALSHRKSVSAEVIVVLPEPKNDHRYVKENVDIVALTTDVPTQSDTIANISFPCLCSAISPL